MKVRLLSMLQRRLGMVRKIKRYYCKKCGKCLRGKEIPKKHQKDYGVTHFGLEVGMYDVDLDRTVKMMCPFCKHCWIIE